MADKPAFDYDYIIIGSGFGGSVSALRLTEKGYRVLVLEKGKWLTGKDFPKTNWNFKRWLWMPLLKFHGLFKLTFFRHVAVLSGVGVGGGSLVYANTLPVPGKKFFEAESWAHLANWEEELRPFYPIALKMLGATPNPRLESGDLALKELAEKIGKAEHFGKTNVAVYFGEAGKTVKDPFFGGAGPDRTGCIFCGGCMLGCRHNAKNTLDKNYLHLAQKHGAVIQAESEVIDVAPLKAADGADGYTIKWHSSTRWFNRKSGTLTSRGVIFSGGVMGTIKLLLKLRKTSLPCLSEQVGQSIRTNSESLIGITTFGKKFDFSKGVAIGSILHTDENSHLEPVRYPAGSGAWRMMMTPMVHGRNIFVRMFRMAKDTLRHPLRTMQAFLVDDLARRTQILLFMQTVNSTLRLKRGILGMKSSISSGESPSAFLPEAKQLADDYARIVDGKPMVLANETLAGIPTTAHILGGAVMGSSELEGVIDAQNRVFGYHNMLICDGSAISANPGVNPSLSITALTERAMSKIPPAATSGVLNNREKIRAVLDAENPLSNP